MHGRLEVAVARVLEQLADVHDERAGQRRRVDPLAILLDLQTALAGFDPQQREHAGILVRTHALLRGGFILAGVAHDLDEGGGVRAEGGFEGVSRCAERLGPRAQQALCDPAQQRFPLGEHRLQLGQVLWPQIGALEAPEVGRRGVGDSGALGPHVDLLAPVDRALCALAAHPGVAPELRAVHILDRELRGLGECEERARHREQPGLQLRGHAVPGEIEKAHIVGRGAQGFAEALGRLGALIELGEVKDGEREIGHATKVGPPCAAPQPCRHAVSCNDTARHLTPG